MSHSVTSRDDVEVLSGALFTWCAERSIRLRSQEGLSVAGAAIDLLLAGYRTQDALLGALADRDSREIAFAS